MLKLLKKNFSLPRMFRLCKSLGKINILSEQNCVFEIELQLKIKSIISQPKIFEKRGVQIFPIKMEGLVKQVGLFFLKKEGVSLISILSNPFQCQVCLCVCVCVFCLFAPFLSVLSVFQRKNLVLQHLINRYMTFKIE